MPESADMCLLLGKPIEVGRLVKGCEGEDFKEEETDHSGIKD